MVLTCDGAKIVASSVDSLFEAHPRLQLEAELLAQKKKRHVRPEGVLYARQKVNTHGKSKKLTFFISEVIKGYHSRQVPSISSIQMHYRPMPNFP